MAPRLRPYKFYDTAVSICSTCYRRVDAKIVFMEGAVWMLKRCPRHGGERVLLADDIDYYRRAREVFVKTPEQTCKPNTPVRYGCPYDCGICPDHEQHGCNILIEVTDSCNLRCPTCYAGSGPERLSHRSLEQIERMLDAAVRNEQEPDVVQISGGEPTIHPRFFEILDAAKRRPIRYLMVNTNGVLITNRPGFAERLAEYRPSFEVYMQFDSLEEEPYRVLRGEELLETKLRAIERLTDVGLPVTLVCTVRRGLNDHELGRLIEFGLEQPAVRGVHFQPVQAAGRLEQYEGGFNVVRDRLTLTEVRRKILEQSDRFTPPDIIPVPCHADSVAMAYALRLGGRVVPLTGLVPPELLIEAGSNTISYEIDGRTHAALFELFSTHHSADSQAGAMRDFLESAASPGFDGGAGLDYSKIFRVLIVQFIDAHSFDLRSIRKTCVHIVHPDAERVIPFDTYNMLYRDHLEREILDPIRREREQSGEVLAPAPAETAATSGSASG